MTAPLPHGVFLEEIHLHRINKMQRRERLFFVNSSVFINSVFRFMMFTELSVMFEYMAFISSKNTAVLKTMLYIHWKRNQERLNLGLNVLLHMHTVAKENHILRYTLSRIGHTPKRKIYIPTST